MAGEIQICTKKTYYNNFHYYLVFFYTQQMGNFSPECYCNKLAFQSMFNV